MNACGIVPAHISLYPCDSYPLCPGETDDVNGGGSHKSKGGMSPGGKAALSLFFIGSAGGVGAAIYFYHTRGHLGGYTYDKDAKKIVKYQANPHNYKAYVDN